MKKHANYLKNVMIGVLTSMLIFSSCNSNEVKNTKGDQEITPPAIDILAAAFLGDVKTIQQHIAAESDLNIKDESTGSTALITAAVFGKTEVARALIDAGADMNIKNYEGSTALHSAAFLCRTEIVSMLLEKGADKEILNNYGSSALISVATPFEDVEAIYDEFSKALGPLGLKLDYAQIQINRPIIAEMLK